VKLTFLASLCHAESAMVIAWTRTWLQVPAIQVSDRAHVQNAALCGWQDVAPALKQHVRLASLASLCQFQGSMAIAWATVVLNGQQISAAATLKVQQAAPFGCQAVAPARDKHVKLTFLASLCHAESAMVIARTRTSLQVPAIQVSDRAHVQNAALCRWQDVAPALKQHVLLASWAGLCHSQGSMAIAWTTVALNGQQISAAATLKVQQAAPFGCQAVAPAWNKHVKLTSLASLCHAGLAMLIAWTRTWLQVPAIQVSDRAHVQNAALCRWQDVAPALRQHAP
jgi:hypothetical protein